MQCEFPIARLIALADGELSPAEAARVREHVSACAACGMMLSRLERSLEAARIIWNSSYASQDGTSLRNRFRIRRQLVKFSLGAVAAGVLLAAIALRPTHDQDRRNAERYTTSVRVQTQLWEYELSPDIEARIQNEAAASEMLVLADSLRDVPGGFDLACERYAYLANAFYSTAAGRTAGERLAAICPREMIR